MIKHLDGVLETVEYKDMDGVRLYINDSTLDYPIHWHTAIEIIMPCENQYSVTVNGKKKVLEEGDICIIPSGVLHILDSPKTQGKRVIIQMDPDMLCRIKNMEFLLPRIQPILVIRKEMIEKLAEERQEPKLSELLIQASEEYLKNELFSSAMVYSIMLRFFAGVGTYFVEKKMFQDTEDKETETNMNGYIEKIMGICTYLKEHCAEEVDMEQVAQMAGFSYYHFSRLFKQMMNISCYHYLIQRRLEYAETLLMEPSISVTEAAMRSGFNSIATFNRVFKKEKGCTPSAFRKLKLSFWES